MSISTVASPKPTVPVVSKAQEQTPEQISDNASKVKSDRDASDAANAYQPPPPPPLPPGQGTRVNQLA
jgi:hypothetical protein